MSEKDDLIRLEDERWAELRSVLERIPEDRMAELAVTEKWSVKDVLGHMASWMAEAAHTLEQMQQGTYEPRRLDIEGMNDEFYDACKDVDLTSIRAELHSGRTRMLQAWAALEEVTPRAAEWFRDSGPGHVDEHIEGLRRAADSLSS